MKIGLSLHVYSLYAIRSKSSILQTRIKKWLSPDFVDMLWVLFCMMICAPSIVLGSAAIFFCSLDARYYFYGMFSRKKMFFKCS